MRTLLPLAMLATAAALATCSVDAVIFTPPNEEDEDCEMPGDEDSNGAADCDDPACASASACAPSCTDSVRNGDETDVDCGGRCPACGDGAACSVDVDCDSGLCGAKVCVRLASCRDILGGGFSTGDGTYSVDPDGPGGGPAFQVKCDMTTDGGGWTRFNWVMGAYPANMDPLEQSLSQCGVTDAICRGRIPASATPVDLMVKDLGDGDIALWRFDASSISNAVLRALRDKLPSCLAQQPPWQPYLYSGTENFCGNGSAGGCDSFVYVDKTGPGCSQTYAGWYVQLDDDTGCYNAAFKMGMPHGGYERSAARCPM